jgi:hypothetical protein
MKTNALILTPWALLSTALLTFTSCSSTSQPPPAVGAARISFTEGVPGGTVVQTFKATATVTAVDQAKRKATLQGADGKKFTVKVGPEAVNFDQIRVGDQVTATVVEKIVAYLDKGGAASDDGTTAVVALAPKGAQPGGSTVETTQMTAKVIAIDAKKRTARLRFEDGSTQTLPVRDDIDLNKRKVGEQVVFRITEMMAISVEKP